LDSPDYTARINNRSSALTFQSGAGGLQV
jgi:hypothetical protein